MEYALIVPALLVLGWLLNCLFGGQPFLQESRKWYLQAREHIEWWTRHGGRTEPPAQS